VVSGNRAVTGIPTTAGIRATAGTLLVATAGFVLAAAAVATPQGADWAVLDDPVGCCRCHLGSPDPFDSAAVWIDGLPEIIQAGQGYRLHIVIDDPALLIAGFLLEITAGNAPAGELRSIDATTETTGARARSTRAGALPQAPGSMRWTLDWTAPPAALGPVRFELWANAGNDDLSPLGDRLHHRLWQLPAGD
jgi:hypothetical protein